MPESEHQQQQQQQQLGAADFTDQDFQLLTKYCIRYEEDNPGKQLSASQLLYESLSNPDTNEPYEKSPFAKFKTSTLGSKLKSYYGAKNKLAALLAKAGTTIGNSIQNVDEYLLRRSDHAECAVIGYTEKFINRSKKTGS